MTKLLIVDDSSIQREVIASLISDLDCSVLFAGDGYEALEAVKANQDIKLITVDFHMPNMGGLEFIEKLREDGTGSVLWIDRNHHNILK